MSLYYVELVGKVEECDWKKYLIAIGSVMNEVLDKVLLVDWYWII